MSQAQLKAQITVILNEYSFIKSGIWSEQEIEFLKVQSSDVFCIQFETLHQQLYFELKPEEAALERPLTLSNYFFDDFFPQSLLSSSVNAVHLSGGSGHSATVPSAQQQPLPSQLPSQLQPPASQSEFNASRRYLRRFRMHDVSEPLTSDVHHSSHYSSHQHAHHTSHHASHHTPHQSQHSFQSVPPSQPSSASLVLPAVQPVPAVQPQPSASSAQQQQPLASP